MYYIPFIFPLSCFRVILSQNYHCGTSLKCEAKAPVFLPSQLMASTDFKFSENSDDGPSGPTDDWILVMIQIPEGLFPLFRKQITLLCDVTLYYYCLYVYTYILYYGCKSQYVGTRPAWWSSALFLFVVCNSLCSKLPIRSVKWS